MKAAATFISIALGVLASIVGFFAAHYWRKASKINIIPDWDSNKVQDAQPRLPPIAIEIAYLDRWRTATAKAFKISSDLNKTAAELTALAVFLGALASIIGSSASLMN